MKNWLDYFGVADSRDIGHSPKWESLIRAAGLAYTQHGHEMVHGLHYMLNGDWLMVFDHKLRSVLYFGLHNGAPLCLKSCMVHNAQPF